MDDMSCDMEYVDDIGSEVADAPVLDDMIGITDMEYDASDVVLTMMRLQNITLMKSTFQRTMKMLEIWNPMSEKIMKNKIFLMN